MPKPHGLALLTLLLALPVGAKELWKLDWVEVRSPHFAIASALGRERSVELAIELESFRWAAEWLTNIGRFEERIPTKVYVLPREDRHLGFDGQLAGYFLPAMRANYAVITSQGSDSDEVLKHEYVHFLVHNRDATLYPPWFDEGFAEVLATLRVKGRALEYGKPARGRLEWLSYGTWMPFKTLLAVRNTQDLSGDRGAMFYAQSWFLMHYLMIGRPGASFGEQNREYLRLSEAGVPAAQAFERAFGIAPSRLQSTLLRYSRKLKYFRMKLKEPLPEVTTAARSMPRDEIAAELGAIAITLGQIDGARRFFGAALAANPANASALVGVGDLHKHDGRYEEAAAHYEQAIALEPGEASHPLDYGEYFLTRASLAEDGEARREFLRQARRYFARSYRLDPRNPETLDQNGLSYLFEGEDPAKAVESLEAAHRLVPAQSDILSHLATAYVAAGQLEKARRPLAKLLAWSHGEAGEELEQLIAQIGLPEAEPDDPPSAADERSQAKLDASA